MTRAIVKQPKVDVAGVIIVDVPNTLLQKHYSITVYVCGYEESTFKTYHQIVVPVKARIKPGDYTFIDTDEEIYSYNALEKMVIDNVNEIQAKHDEFTESMSTNYENFTNSYEQRVNNMEIQVQEVTDLVNGQMSLGDAETLDGHDSTYFATQESIVNITNGTTMVGNAEKLNNHDVNYFATASSVEELRQAIESGSEVGDADQIGALTSDNFPNVSGLNVSKTIYLSPTGSNENDGLTIETPMLSIEEAIKRYKGAYGITLNLAVGTYEMNASEQINGFNRISLVGKSSDGKTPEVIINATGGSLTFSDGVVLCSNVTFNTDSGIMFNNCEARFVTCGFYPIGETSISYMIKAYYGHLSIGQSTFGNCSTAIMCQSGVVNSFNNSVAEGSTINRAHMATHSAIIVEQCSAALSTATASNHNTISSGGTVISTGNTRSYDEFQVRTTTLLDSVPTTCMDGSIVAVYE